MFQYFFYLFLSFFIFLSFFFIFISFFLLYKNNYDNDYLFFLFSQMHHFHNEKNPATILNW